MKAETEGTLALGVVILAAGRSRRMGQSKMLLPWRGTTVLGHLVSQWRALRVTQLAVVCAAGDETIEAEVDRLGFPATDHIRNPAPERGMFSSLQCAASWRGWVTGLTHWVIALGDQPHLRSETLARLVTFARSHPEAICQPAYAGRSRHPVLLPKPVFFALADSACSNFKEFLKPHKVSRCEINDPGLELDLDSPEDYRRALEIFPGN